MPLFYSTLLEPIMSQKSCCRKHCGMPCTPANHSVLMLRSHPMPRSRSAPQGCIQSLLTDAMQTYDTATRFSRVRCEGDTISGTSHSKCESLNISTSETNQRDATAQ